MSIAVLVDYIDQYRDQFGSSPTAGSYIGLDTDRLQQQLRRQVPRRVSARTVAVAQRLEVIRQVHAGNYGVYGVCEMRAELNHRGHPIAR